MTQNFPRRVLVVDDEPLIRWSIAETLKGHGHTVLEAENGAEALRALQLPSARVDAIVLDYHLPDTNDLSLLARVRGIAPRAPVILMTAFGAPEVVEEACRLGAYVILNKPFEMNELAAVVSRACEAGSCVDTVHRSRARPGAMVPGPAGRIEE